MIIDRLKLFLQVKNKNKLLIKILLLVFVLLFFTSIFLIIHENRIIKNMDYDQIYDTKTRSVIGIGDSMESIEKLIGNGKVFLRESDSIWYEYKGIRIEYRSNKCISLLILKSKSIYNKRYRNNKGLSLGDSKKTVYNKYLHYNDRDHFDIDFLKLLYSDGKISKYYSPETNLLNENNIVLFFEFDPMDSQIRLRKYKMNMICISLENFS